MIVEIKREDFGRILKLNIRGKLLLTPHFFPVVKPGYKIYRKPTLDGIFSDAVITSAYLLRKSKNERPLREIFDYDGIFMTDSGAYQALLYRSSLPVSPEEIVEYQKLIDTDIGVILDEPVLPDDSEEEAMRKAEETLKRAREAPIDEDRERVMPIHGVGKPRVLKYMLSKADFSRFSIAALGGVVPYMDAYDYAPVIEAVIIARDLLPPYVPLHVFGAGHPTLIPFLIAAGADTFDSASFALYARDNRYITPRGTYYLDELEELPCSCPICFSRSPEELKDKKLLEMHNFLTIYYEVIRVREAIRLGRLREYLERKARTHPAAMDALKTLIKYRELIRPRTPRIRNRGMFVYDELSLQRPDAPERPKVELREPYKISYKPVLRELGEYKENVYYASVRGLIPAELSETYPFAQTEAPRYLKEKLLGRYHNHKHEDGISGRGEEERE